MKLVLLTKMHKKAISLIEELLSANPDTIDQRNNKGLTALMIAVCNVDTCSTENTVKLLIDMGANVNLQDNRLSSTLGYAQLNKGDSIFEMLINEGVNVNFQDINGESVLMSTVTYVGNLGKIKLLIDAGADINLQTKGGETALMMVCERQIYDGGIIIQLLINNGADINLKNNNGKTAFMLILDNIHYKKYEEDVIYNIFKPFIDAKFNSIYIKKATK